ncbi:hypothetical protein CLPU_11c00550 [Gottschalkia purinilytica]|uniref:Uncharacterized protein n=1 Tax=Gottschalkia purinilytica TaxID=1503 RepID=A0A0L0W8V4_GOTPU|nr:hypothetical protein [Gottschalkia purinilytica]KNF07886.1 hypothetical protein CLPU_11c00550 [Gottschalkia purinilytica]
MTNLATIIIAFVIAAVVLIVHNSLSKHKNWLLGGIIPLLSIIFSVGVFYFLKLTPSSKNIFPFFIFVTLQLSTWVEGRRKYKKEQEAELKKMKSKDL